MNSIEYRILEAIRENPGVSRSDLVAILSLPYSTIKYHTQILQNKGRIVSGYAPGNCTKLRYAIGVDCNNCRYSTEFLLVHCSSCIHNEDFGDYYQPNQETQKKLEKIR